MMNRVVMTEGWHCKNGHILMKTIHGNGCLKQGCQYRLWTLNRSEPKKKAKKPGPKPKGK